MKILIVEDEEILKKVLQEKFKKENFTVELVTDGSAVIPTAKDFKPDLMILDIMLPKKDGITVLREMKQDPELQNIPVMVMSNLGEDEKIKSALSLGAVDYLVKAQHPINELVEKARDYLLKLGAQ